MQATANTGTLNDLIKVLRDGQHGFAAAADDAERADLKSLFHKYSAQRKQFVEELQLGVESMGEDAENSGSIAGAVHRGWINFKAAVVKREDLAVLEECERGEDVAKETYEKALADESLGSMRDKIQRQYAQVKEAHDTVRGLRNSLKAQ